MKAILAPLIVALFSGLLACASNNEQNPSLSWAKAETEEVSLERARQLIDQGKIVDAITAFRTLLRRDGPSLPVLNGLAIAHAELGRPDLAAGLFAEALALAPDDPATLNNIGYAALRREETGLARYYLEMAERRRSGAPEITGNLDVLERLEAWIKAPVVGKALTSGHPGENAFTVQRKTTSTVELSGLQPFRTTEPPKRKLVPPPTTSLIDFSDVLDPWSTPNRPNEPLS